METLEAELAELSVPYDEFRQHALRPVLRADDQSLGGESRG